jgi:hypothetical protein
VAPDALFEVKELVHHKEDAVTPHHAPYQFHERSALLIEG